MLYLALIHFLLTLDLAYQINNKKHFEIQSVFYCFVFQSTFNSHNTN